MKIIPIDLKIHLLELEIKSINVEIEKLKYLQSIAVAIKQKPDNQLKPQSNTLKNAIC